MLRVGIGNDTHKLVEGRPLMLGGVNVPCEVGGAGHSEEGLEALRQWLLMQRENRNPHLSGHIVVSARLDLYLVFV